jgi:hypothetical protein
MGKKERRLFRVFLGDRACRKVRDDLIKSGRDTIELREKGIMGHLRKCQSEFKIQYDDALGDLIAEYVISPELLQIWRGGEPARTRARDEDFAEAHREHDEVRILASEKQFKDALTDFQRGIFSSSDSEYHFVW